jgi:hypothetical protein
LIAARRSTAHGRATLSSKARGRVEFGFSGFTAQDKADIIAFLKLL